LGGGARRHRRRRHGDSRPCCRPGGLTLPPLLAAPRRAGGQQSAACWCGKGAKEEGGGKGVFGEWGEGSEACLCVQQPGLRGRGGARSIQTPTVGTTTTVLGLCGLQGSSSLAPIEASRKPVCVCVATCVSIDRSMGDEFGWGFGHAQSPPCACVCAHGGAQPPTRSSSHCKVGRLQAGSQPARRAHAVVDGIQHASKPSQSQDRRPP
jgi:hypothetical protein